jgi:hypothetical protein
LPSVSSICNEIEGIRELRGGDVEREEKERISGGTSFSIMRIYFAEIVRWFISCTIGIRISFF